MRKEEFIRKFLPKSVEEIKVIEINLDDTDLGLADVLRNLNTLYPEHQRNRNLIKDGRLAVAVRCNSELLDPLSGIILIIFNDQLGQVVSKRFAVGIFNETILSKDETINEALEDFSKYLIKEYKDTIEEFNSFYVKFVYDRQEEETDDETAVY